MAETKRIPITLIDLPDEATALRRPEVDDPEWGLFVDSIKKNGLLNPFSVRKNGDRYMVVDGSRRFTACKQLADSGDQNFVEITANVIDTNDVDSMFLQIIGNATQKKTPNASYAKSLQKILFVKQMTIEQLAATLSWSVQYTQQILGVNKLPEAVRKLIDEGRITISNAIIMQKLPAELVEDPVWIEKAMTMGGVEFTTEVKNASKNVAREKRAEKEGQPKTFEPFASLRKRADLEATMLQKKEQFKQEPTDYNRGWAEALLWAFQLDESSIAEKKAKWEAEMQESEANKKKREEERNKAKIEEAQETLRKAGLLK